MKIFSKSRDSSSDGGIFCYSRGQTNTTNFVVNNARLLKPGSRCIKSKIISERDVVSHKVNKHNTVHFFITYNVGEGYFPIHYENYSL